MKAIIAGKGAAYVVRQRKLLCFPTNSSTSFSGLPVDSNNRGLRLVCRASPKESVSDVKATEKEAVREALKALAEGVQYENKSVGIDTEKLAHPSVKDASPGLLEKALATIPKIVGAGLFNLLQYKSTEKRGYWFRENFGPVDEIGDRVPVQIISGAIPQNFPAGTYIRTGSNPLFGGNDFECLLGVTKLHWFEGDGMLHAVYFDKCGDSYQLSYKNKYVETEGYLVDKKEGKPTVISAALEGDGAALIAGLALNQLQFGWITKPCGNTSLWTHGGKTYVVAENHLPHEINLSDLSTVGTLNWEGTWARPMCTSHPKIDPHTKEMIIQGTDYVKQPHNTVGVVSADGRRVVNKVEVGVDRATMGHDILITERYTVIMDFPLSIDINQLAKGESAVKFENEGVARFGIMPRHGDANSVRWFEVKAAAMFHMFNAYEDGNEVVAHGLTSKNWFFETSNMEDRVQWFRRGITLGNPGQPGYDPLKDGALMTTIREWRMDLQSGTVTERDIDDQENYGLMEMPHFNQAYVGRKYKYAYALNQHYDRSWKSGLPYYGSLGKVDFSASANGKDRVKVQFHDFGPDRYGSEPFFVAKPGSTVEDDGWVVSYVYDESTNGSELVIIDAQKFMEEPVTRIKLPQRVPFGFHGTYVYAE